MNIFKIKKNDSRPALAVTLQYANGSAVDLTSGTVFFNLGTTLYLPYYSGAAVITDAVNGLVQYNWTGSIDTGSIGTYYGEFEITWTGSKMTLPSDHSLQVIVYEDYN